MRRFAPLVFIMAAMPVAAQDAAPKPPAKPPQISRNDIVLDPLAREAALKELFGRLKATGKDDAAVVQATIDALLAQTGNAASDLFIDWGMESVKTGDSAQALDYFDGAVLLSPNAAECYHKRAIVHYARNEHGEALADLRRALALEPRHTGVLLGLGALFSDIGEDKQALNAFRKALELNPYLEDAKKLEAQLAKKVDGDGI